MAQIQIRQLLTGTLKNYLPKWSKDEKPAAATFPPGQVTKCCCKMKFQMKQVGKFAFTESVAESRPSWFCKLQIGGNLWYDPVRGVPGVSSPRLCKGGTEEVEIPLW